MNHFTRWESDLVSIREKREALKKILETLQLYDAGLASHEEYLGLLCMAADDLQSVETTVASWQLPLPGITTTTKNDNKKSDVQIMEDILTEYGPMHVSELVKLGPARGVPFKGSKKPTLMARDKMVSSKRFQLFGGNVWGVMGKNPVRALTPMGTNRRKSLITREWMGVDPPSYLYRESVSRRTSPHKGGKM